MKYVIDLASKKYQNKSGYELNKLMEDKGYRFFTGFDYDSKHAGKRQLLCKSENTLSIIILANGEYLFSVCRSKYEEKQGYVLSTFNNLPMREV